MKDPSVSHDELILLVSLWVDEADIERFEAFERRAVRRMSRYGGHLERAIRFHDRTNADQPFEVHVVRFPDEASLRAYQQDPETQRAVESRDRIISRSHVAFGRDVTPYGSLPSGSETP